MNRLPVVMLPGTLTPGNFYQQTINLLKEGAVYFDWMLEVPGCSVPSAAEAVKNFINTTGAPVVLVGHSTGAAISAYVALTSPRLVAAILLINSGPHMYGGGDFQGMLNKLRSSAGVDLWREFALRNVADGSPPEWIDRMVEFSNIAGPLTAASVLASQYSIDFTQMGLTGFQPAEALYGVLDVKRSLAESQAWAQIFPDLQVTQIENCGHTPPIEAPDLVAAAVERLQVRAGYVSGLG